MAIFLLLKIFEIGFLHGPCFVCLLKWLGGNWLMICAACFFMAMVSTVLHFMLLFSNFLMFKKNKEP